MAKRLKLYLYLAKTTVHVEEKHTELRLEKIIIEPHSTSESLTLQLCFVRMTTDSNGAVNVTTREMLVLYAGTQFTNIEFNVHCTCLTAN